MATTDHGASDPSEALDWAWDSNDHPWRRFGARVIDNTLFSFIFSFLLAVILTAGIWPAGAHWLSRGTGSLHLLFMSVMAVVACAFGTAFCLPRWSATPGKWLFGIRVVGEDNSLLSQRQANLRELSLLWWGVGFGVMYLTWIMTARSFFELRAKHRTRWDTKVGATVHGRALNGRMYAQLVIGFLLAVIIQGAQIYMIVAGGLVRLGASGQSSLPS